MKTVLTMLGALAVLMLGVVPVLTMNHPAATAACHDMSMAGDQTPARPPQPGKAMAAMGCCVACMASPAVAPSPEAAPVPSASPVSPAPDALPVGRSPSPEPAPPRL